MLEERRGQQNTSLITGSLPASRGHMVGTQLDSFPDRWIRISRKAKNPNFVFQNLFMHIHEDSLREAYKALDGSKALGVDRVSKKKYGLNLEENLKDLAQRVRRGTYRPQPKREVLIPKAGGKTRPIAISCFEDKLVDWVVGRILQEAYEPTFIRNSFGYRPSKSAHQAVEACYYSVEKNKRPHALEIDFSNFFNTIPHKKLMRVISKRITDRRFKGLIGRFLVAGLITSVGEETLPKKGTPQGGIMSPILANIYLDEVVDKWFLKNYASYNNIIVRYADDGLFFFRKEEDALKFKSELEIRCERYGLQLHKEKTKLINMSKTSTESFDFLGFTFYWGKQGSRRILKVKTQKEKLHRAMREFDLWIKTRRNSSKLSKLWEIAKSKIRGHINYYGYWMNGLKINHFLQQAKRSLFKWLNRRSQKRSYVWSGFEERIKFFPLWPLWEKMKLKRLGRSFGSI